MAALAGLVLLAFGVAGVASWRAVALVVVAAGLGLVLHHAAFGFTAGYRALLSERRTVHARAQLLMLGLAVALFFPALAAGQLFGQPVRGFVFPVGLELVLGAFIFGLGMQIANACGSGTLYVAGAGSARMLVALVFVVIGATGAAFLHEHWAGLPRFPAVSLPQQVGLFGALALHAAVLGGLWLVLLMIEKRRHGSVVSIWRAERASLFGGRWSPGVGAVALVGLAFATLWLAGRPWGITQAFALWGSKVVEAVGVDDPAFWSFWEEPTRVEWLARPLLADVTSVMNIALMLGALLAAGLAGQVAPRFKLPLSAWLSAIVGGLLLGAGAIIGTGCNISALFSGVASGSLHAWVWLVAALAGNAAGLVLRPLFGFARKPA
jgi:hypothetical protein